MRDIIPELRKWIDEGESIALATVVQTWGSSPRRLGARMGMTASGRITGSVSGGCVEAEVIEAGLEGLQTGRPKLLDFKVADETAWQVGLACGGSIQILVKPLDVPTALAFMAAVDASLPVADLMVVRGPEPLLGAEVLLSREGRIAGDLEGSLEGEARSLAEMALTDRRAGHFDLQSGRETLRLFADVILPPPVVVVVGGVHVAVALCSIARTLGYRTVVVDPRGVFGSRDRFPQVDLLIQSWPQEAFSEFELHADSAVCMLTHDPKIDDEGLMLALRSPAFYVGALGSRKTQAARRERLLNAGITQEQLARLRGPIGLDIGAETPEEIALAIMAEIVAARNLQAPAESEHITRAGERSR